MNIKNFKKFAKKPCNFQNDQICHKLIGITCEKDYNINSICQV